MARGAEDEKLRRLTECFAKFGAYDPEDWARSEVEEGIPQYARFVFLHAAWKNVIGDGDTGWMDSLRDGARKHPRGPGAGAGPAIERILAAGASPEDLSEVVRVMSGTSSPGSRTNLPTLVVDYPSEDLPRVNWALVEVNDDDEVVGMIDVLHESVLDTDPSGREMRPRGVGREG